MNWNKEINMKWVVAGVAALVLGGLVYWMVQGTITRERQKQAALVAARSAEEAAKVAKAAAKAKALAERKESLELLAAGKLVAWGGEQFAIRRALAGTVKDLEKHPSICPAYKTLSDKPEPRDEFDRSARAQEMTRLLEACFAGLKARLQPLPPLVYRWCFIDENPNYDFSSNQFRLKISSCKLLDDRIWYLRAGDDSVAIDGAGKGGIVGGQDIWLWVPEARAKALNQRMKVYPLKLEIAFRPGEFGETDVMESNHFAGMDLGPSRVSAFHGKAVAFRIVALFDPIVDWTPYGLDENDKEAVAKVRYTDDLAKPRSQQLRAKMSRQELATLRAELSKAHSSQRWAVEEQAHYVDLCLKAKAEDPSINTRVCKCTLEMVMERHASMADYTAWRSSNQGAAPDSDLAGWFGSCGAAFGD